jgi:hypothetical protein
MAIPAQHRVGRHVAFITITTPGRHGEVVGAIVPLLTLGGPDVLVGGQDRAKHYRHGVPQTVVACHRQLRSSPSRSAPTTADPADIQTDDERADVDAMVMAVSGYITGRDRGLRIFHAGLRVARRPGARRFRRLSKRADRYPPGRCHQRDRPQRLPGAWPVSRVTEGAPHAGLSTLTVLAVNEVAASSWTGKRAGALTAPPPLGSRRHQVLGEAPGDYVHG